jgi:deoxyhypusine synthase
MLPREMKQGRDGRTMPRQSKPVQKGPIGDFIAHQFRHFNAATLSDAADGYSKLIDAGGLMFVSLAGAMSTGEIGLTLAEMIREGKVSGISCTGANLEEDIFNLVAHDDYKRFPDYRDITPDDDQQLFKQHINRVTDTGIPEKAAMTVIEDKVIELWKKADAAGKRKLPHEFLYELLNSNALADDYAIDPDESWMLAAANANLPIFVPGWEDSTLGNVFAALCLKDEIKDPNTMRSGIEYMMDLARWYWKTSTTHQIGFFQIGGGIAGDFSICVVPLLMQDLGRKQTPLWAYFCQISDAIESYGGYSGAAASEKVSWGKIGPDTPTFMIQSDASICVPLIFAKVLGW